MSGTSLDGLDVVAARLSLDDAGGVTLREHRHMAFDYDPALRHRVLAVTEGRPLPAEAFLALHHDLGHWMARLAQEAVLGWGLKNVALAGLHGQTVWHAPAPRQEPEASPSGATWQMGEAGYLALVLGCPVVSDFRTHDLLVGGQGAPLVPLAQSCLLQGRGGELPLVTLNLGGIVNGAVFAPGRPVAASDFGPCNLWLNAALGLYGHDEPYDEGGCRGLSGAVNKNLLAAIEAWDDFPGSPPPASTGREHYTEDALRALLESCPGGRPTLPDALATLAAFTAHCVARGLVALGLDPQDRFELCVGGGGVCNEALMQAIRAELPQANHQGCGIVFGVPPQALEALCFAVLALLREREVPLAAPGVTGAERPVLLGKITVV